MNNFVVFLGAGASVPFGIPTMTKMVQDFEQKLKSEYSQYFELFNDIKYRLKHYNSFDIEALITVLKDIIDFDRVPRTVFGNPSIHYFLHGGISFEQYKKESLSGRDKAEELLKNVKNYIAEVCCIKDELPFELYDEFFNKILSKYTGYSYLDNVFKRKGQKQQECDVFTTNYDKVIEAYCNNRGLEYECGHKRDLTVDISAKSKLYENDGLFHIFKLHGSTYWYIDQNNSRHWLTQPAQVGSVTHLGDKIVKELFIYPAQEKYTFREPFYYMFHHLKARLSNINSCNACYIVGYSFRDDDILGLFTDAMDLNERLSLFLIDSNADTIIKERFPNYSRRIRPIQSEFSIQAIQGLV